MYSYTLKKTKNTNHGTDLSPRNGTNQVLWHRPMSKKRYKSSTMAQTYFQETVQIKYCGTDLFPRNGTNQVLWHKPISKKRYKSSTVAQTYFQETVQIKYYGTDLCPRNGTNQILDLYRFLDIGLCHTMYSLLQWNLV